MYGLMLDKTDRSTVLKEYISQIKGERSRKKGSAPTSFI